MNQVYQMDTRLGNAQVLFNTIHHDVRSVKVDGKDVTSTLGAYEINDLQLALKSNRFYKRDIGNALVVRTGNGLFVFPLRGRNCASRRFEMAIQIAMHFYNTRTGLDPDWVTSTAKRYADQAERYTGVILEAGDFEWKLKLPEITFKTRNSHELIMLEGK